MSFHDRETTLLRMVGLVLLARAGGTVAITRAEYDAVFERVVGVDGGFTPDGSALVVTLEQALASAP